MAEQKTAFEKKQQEELLAQYQKEQEVLSNRALLGDEKAKLGLSFLYDAPPGLKKKEEPEGQQEVKFEWQRKYNAPREAYAKDDDTIRDQPFGIEVRNVRCIKCRQWGHVNTDKICPLYGKNLTAEPELPTSSNESLLSSMKSEGFALKNSVLSKMMGSDPDESHAILAQEDEDDPEVKFLKSLTPKQKKKLLKKLNSLQSTSDKGIGKKSKHKKKKSKSKKKSSDSDSSDDEGAKSKRSKSSKHHRSSSSSESEGEDHHRKGRHSDKSHKQKEHRDRGGRSISPASHKRENGAKEASHRDRSNSNRHRRTDRSSSPEERHRHDERRDRQDERRERHDERRDDKYAGRRSPDHHRNKNRREEKSYSPSDRKRKSGKDKRDASDSDDSGRGASYSGKQRKRHDRDSRSGSRGKYESRKGDKRRNK
ncbi:hypothetical protein EGW08_018830 [Elysia chlorotica]|uniref:CBF1-interacting co-repressor CIR N-terminal domain-containing protein n=1 Tax=Elysia chlorotica TaxID=188477 RepID=A0A3S1H6U9_ELYCH|nr:hypothetical protein EGW08_018830 [Elysia chlorotica]